MIRRHTSYQTYYRGMLDELLKPAIDVPGEPAKVNPLASMDAANRAGPLQAILLGWSTVGDVLTFYQDRIADERALSTAREDFSAYAITRMVGYNPRPAISAHASLAFNVVADRPDAGVIIPKGTAIGNVPAEGKLPAVFETSADLCAYPGWNDVALALDDAPVPAKLAPGATRLVLAGIELVANGSAIVIRVRETLGIRMLAVIVAEALVDRAHETTLVRWEPSASNAIAGGEEVLDVSMLDLRVRPFGALAGPYALASPADRRKYALGGVSVRKDASWGSVSGGLVQSPAVLAVGRDGLFGIVGNAFMRRQWDGTWAVSTPFAGAVAQSIVVTPGGRLAVGTVTGGVFVSVDDGLTWMALGDGTVTSKERLGPYQVQRLPSLPIRSIAIDEGGEAPVVFIATDRGVASISLNGDVWTWRNNGFPGTDAKTGFAALAAMQLTFADAAGTLLVATTYGVFRSTRADAWERVQGVGSVSQIAVVPGGGLIAIGSGGVFRSDDAITWEKALDVAGTPRVLAANVGTVAVAAGSDVYVSDDGGTTWASVPNMLKSTVSAIAVGRDGIIAVSAPFIDDPAGDWPGLELAGNTLWLDRELVVAPGDLLVVSSNDTQNGTSEAYVVRSSATELRADFGLVGISTRVTLDRRLSPLLCDARRVVVYLGARSRFVVPVKREAPASPTIMLDVPRGLPALAPGRALAVEGRSPRILLRGIAGGAIRLDARGDGTVDVRPAFSSDDALTVVPDLDVDAATRYGERGIALARFDGIWICGDLDVQHGWAPLASPPIAVTGLAAQDTMLYACGVGRDGPKTSGVYAFADGAWKLVLAGVIRRLVAAHDTLWACGDHGLFEMRDGIWGIADPQFEGRAVRDVAADTTTILAATDDGIFARDARGWRRVSGLEGMSVTAVALANDRWYAGTAGAGTWQTAAGTVLWSPLDRRSRSAEVTALYADARVMFAAERGRGITSRGELLEATLASNVRAFIAVELKDGPTILAFRGVPLLPATRRAGAPVPMRRFVGILAYEHTDTQTLDAGMLPASLRGGIEGILSVKLADAETIVEEIGRAWRIRAGEPMPLYLLRREPAAMSIFEVHQFELTNPPARMNAGAPDAHLADDVPALWKLASAPAYPSTLVARADEVWYAPARANALSRSEIATVATHDRSQVLLRRPLANAYDPRTIAISANVVDATHGATIAVDEAIASGDASAPAQKADLVAKPLTNVLSEDGIPVPALDVWVRADVAQDAVAAISALADRSSDSDMVQWQCVPNFLRSDELARHYVVRQDAEGRARLTFGDGENGRKLPSGRDNVIARYRTGTGPNGNVGANALTLFQRPRPAVTRVRNPLPSSGGADAERASDLRRSVLLGLVALGRIVAQRDLVDYIQAWPAVAKVHITRSRTLRRSRAREMLVVTFAAAPGQSVDAGALLNAAQRDGATHWLLRILPYRERPFCVEARIFADPTFDANEVLAQAREALLDAYSFDARALCEDVGASSIVALLQSVRGVRAVILENLFESSTNRHNEACLTGDDGATDEAASLLVIDPEGIVLTNAVDRAEAVVR